ncbi:NAD-dependent epimerase/dehydratase family protein [Otoolea muris]|uniref:NAD-dependent epimerase/dehydratase family protein n=1 Tax=Otoolea muris TaxID=2941515 RepID=UPI003A7F3AA7
MFPVGVKQFIFISTAGVYAERDRIGRRIVIGPESPIGPYTEYGRSKWMAECALNERYAKQNGEFYKYLHRGLYAVFLFCPVKK